MSRTARGIRHVAHRLWKRSPRLQRNVGSSTARQCSSARRAPPRLFLTSPLKRIGNFYATAFALFRNNPITYGCVFFFLIRLIVSFLLAIKYGCGGREMKGGGRPTVRRRLVSTASLTSDSGCAPFHVAKFLVSIRRYAGGRKCVTTFRRSQIFIPKLGFDWKIGHFQLKMYSSSLRITGKTEKSTEF